MRFSRLRVAVTSLSIVLLASLAAARVAPAQASARDSVRRAATPGLLLRDTIRAGRRDTIPRLAAPDTAAELPWLHIRFVRDSLRLDRPAPFLPFGRLSDVRTTGEAVAGARVAALMRATAAQRSAVWGQTIGSAFGNTALPDSAGAVAAAATAQTATPAAVPASPVVVPALSGDTTITGRARTDTVPRVNMPNPFGQYADLGLQLQSRLEAKLERNKNERCTSFDFLNPAGNCRGSIQPQFDFQFGVRTGGVVADRVHVNVDYNSEREFDASNNISVYYEGKSDEIINRVEVGNVSFAPPASRFITGGIPAGNYGLQATGQLGPMSFRTIIAQQKGNVVKDRVFTIGDRTVQTVERDIEDYQVERRRFFWVVQPDSAFAGRYPNIDILDANALTNLALGIPASRRPRQVRIYRYRPPGVGGTATNNINGPYAITLGARTQSEVGPYEVLEPGRDYYIDPTNLWVALVSPINRGERLAVSYTVSASDGGEVAIGSVGGTVPTQRGAAGADTVLLLWDGEVLPSDAAFTREMRNVYRLGGEDIQRGTVSLKVVVGSGNDQEQPRGGSAQTYLQLFGLAQRSNTSAFDVENRLWPRLGDPNQAVGGTNAKLIKDFFVIFPSLRPFADPTFVRPPDPTNDSLYRTPDEDLSTQRRPATQYRIRTRYSAEGGGESGSLALGSVQVRPNSERLVMGGVMLQRDVDYRVDYEQGRVTFLRPDTLFSRPQQVAVQYEENPLFASAPTSIFGFAAQFPFTNGQLNFVAISQAQKTTFNRPPLGFEPASALVAGVSGNFNFETPLLTTFLDKLPMVETSVPSTINIQGEFATSRPQPNAAGVAYVESFEGDAGSIQLNLGLAAWRYGSQPVVGSALAPGLGAFAFDTSRATTLAWQNLGSPIVPSNQPGKLDSLGAPINFLPEQIDPQLSFTSGQGFRQPEQLLWLTLFPTDVGGIFCNECPRSDFTWRLPLRSGRRWRSISQSLGTTGVDLSRVEQLEFWALVDTSLANRRKNVTLVFDFGDVSENSIAFVPETLTVRRAAATTARHLVDSLFTGRKLQGFDRLDTERDPLTKSFDVSLNDRGLPGDVAESLVVVDADNGRVVTLPNVPLCRGGSAQVEVLGDTKDNCTVGNRRLDEEDLNIDNFLDIPSNARSTERVLRYVTDLSDPRTYNRIGGCFATVSDTSSSGVQQRNFCWVQVRVPFSAPADSINSPLRRRIKAARLTVVSSAAAPDTGFGGQQLAIARLRLIGSPWVKRADRAIAGVGGALASGSGYVLASVIGTQDRDSTANLFYQSPPGVVDQAEARTADLAAGSVQINERSLRLVTGNLPRLARAEAFYRFPEGEKSFMGYREMRVWARGRNKGWGPNGDLQFYVKIGRDQDNFYFYRTPVNEGLTVDAWLPEIRIDFDKLRALRAEIQNNYLRNGEQIACTGLDRQLVDSSAAPAAPGSKLYAACSDGYIAYTANPAITPPNLAAVQELSVGILRVADAGLGSGGTITFNDSLEVWVDDIRLTGVVDDAGYAGQLGMSISAGDVGTIQLNVSRRDKNFRQLAEQPTYITDNQVGIATSFRLDKFLPQALGLIMPMSISYSSSASDPFFVSRSDVRASGIEGLRRPSNSATSYSLSLRRAAPLRNALLGLVFNNLGLVTSYSRASSRSEYQVGRSTSYTALVDWNLSANPRTFGTPGWLDRAILHLPGFLRNSDFMRSARESQFRYNPTQIRFTSAYARNADRRNTFSLPVAVDSGDVARRVTGLTNVLRNTGAIQLRPIPSLSLSWGLNSIRDLRDYGDTVAFGGTRNVGAIARGERTRLLGMDVGLERERQMDASINLTPALTAWLKPRLEFSTTYSMFRDPNSPSVLQLDSTGPYRLPRRLSNSQGFGAGAAVDLARAIALHTRDSSLVRRMANVFLPIEVTWRRDLRSAFDGVPFTPGFGYQFGLGSVSDFRSARGVFATSAGETRNFAVNNAFALPYGARVQSRYSVASSNVWTRRLSAQALLEQRTVAFPDLSVQWTFQPVFLRKVIRSIGAQAGVRVEKTVTDQPALGDPSAAATAGAAGLHGEVESRGYPLTGSITWAFAGGFSTTGGWRRTDRTELRSGGSTVGKQSDVTGQVGKSFKLPARFKAVSDLRWSMGFSQNRSENYFVSDTTRRRVLDNGRWAINTNADTDISQTMGFSMTLSRVVTYDNLYDRRFTQMVLTATLQLSFFAGELR
ncbi:MAG: cell surface protein SprA [Gemmatimonadaceae bacterium]